MKAAWLIPVVLAATGCGGSESGSRPGAASAGASALGGSAGLSGSSGGGAGPSAGSSTGGLPATAGSVGTGGVPAVGGGGGAAAGSATGGVGEPGTHGRPDQRTVVYLPEWRGSLAAWASKLDYSRISYLNLCFADISAGGDISYKDAGLDAFVSAAHAQGVKVCMAIGGATVIDDGGVFASVLQDGERDAFVGKLDQYAIDHQLDCIDVDLEGNGVNQYYEAFVTSLATKLHASQKELTSAVSSWFGDKITDQALQVFDFINVMAYDLHNPGGSSQPVQSSSLADAQAEVDYWVNRGLPKGRAVFGVPFYGYRWTTAKGEALTYSEILAQAPAAATQDQVTLNGAVTYLNSRATIIEKAKLAKTYGGIMVWELGQDAAGDASLLKAIADATE